MRLSELYRSGKPEISIELYPPKTPEAVEQLFETVEQLKRLKPAYFSMTFGAAGSTRDLTLELCNRLKNRSKVETTCHLSIVGQSKSDTRENLKRLKGLGVYNLLALRGDPPRDQPNFTPHPDGFHSSVELIGEIRTDPWFSIAVTGFPEKHPDAADESADIAYLKKKIEAGGSVIITQLFFDNRHFFRFLERVRAAGITAPVVPGILPILSVPQVRRFTALCGSTIPPEIEKRLGALEKDEDGAIQYGIELSTRMCAELVKGGVPGLHFYALNRPRSVEVILKNLRIAPTV